MWPSLVALVGTVAVVVGLLVAFGDRLGDSGDDDPAAGDVVDDPTSDPTGQPTDTPTDTPTGGDESGEGGGEPDPSVTTADPEDREPIGVLNATDIDGLEDEAEDLFTEGGWEVPATATYDGTVDVTTVFYPDGMEDAAQALMDQFPEVMQLEPTIEGINDTRLVVILGDDFAETAGSSD